MGYLQWQGVSKSFGQTSVIQDFNLEIDQGSFVVLVGPSGCGKSTLLRMLAGLEPLSAGTILLKDKPIHELTPQNRPVAMVFQDYALYPHMTVFDNMAFGLKIQKMSRSEINSRVEKTAELLDLVPYLKRKPAALSGGQRQRVAMGRALVKNREICLFDEPLSNLDAKLRSRMRAEIKRFHQTRGITSIYVTHDQLEAMTLADQLIVVNRGRIEQKGTPLEVFDAPNSRFVAEFIGSPAMNFFDCRFKLVLGKPYVTQKYSGTTPGFVFELPESKRHLFLEDRDVTLGIRPSDIYLYDPQDPNAPHWRDSAEIQIVELVGRNAYVTMKSHGCEFTGEIMGRHIPTVGEKREFVFNLKHAHFFEPSTGKNLLERVSKR